MLFGVSFKLLFASATADSDGCSRLFGGLGWLTADRALPAFSGGKFLQTGENVAIELSFALSAAKLHLNASGLALGVNGLPLNWALGIYGIGKCTREVKNKAK